MNERYQIFTGLILNISRCIQKIKNTEMAVLGLKGKQVQCLFALYHLPNGASLKQLCELCDGDKGALSRTLKGLMEKDLVFVEQKDDQKYRNPVKLTTKGREYARVVVDKISSMIGLGGDGITQAERDIFYKALTQVSDNLTKICENYGGKND